MCKWQTEKIIRENAFEQNNKKPPGILLILAVQVFAAPKGMVFGSFWSENEYTLCPFGLESSIVFEGTKGVRERIYRFNSK